MAEEARDGAEHEADGQEEHCPVEARVVAGRGSDVVLLMALELLRRRRDLKLREWRTLGPASGRAVSPTPVKKLLPRPLMTWGMWLLCSIAVRNVSKVARGV